MFFHRDIGIDLGTANTLVYAKGRGIIINEPSVVAINKKTGQVLAVGEEARKMVGKTPGHIVATKPLVGGVVSDFEITEQMLRYFIDKVCGKRFFPWPQPRLVIGVPCGVTEVEKKAVEDAARNAGAGEVYLIEEPMAAAIGARLPVQEAGGNMIVDIGGGTTEVAVISLGGIVSASSVRVGGDKFDSAIENYIKEKYDLAIGEQTAERIKIQIGSAMPPKEEKKMRIKGRDLVLGLPKTIEISSTEICQSLQDQLGEILQCVKSVLKETPPEISADIMDKGMVLAGGGSLLRRIDEYLAKNTGVPSQIAEEPFFCVAKGTGIVLEHLDTYKKSIMAKKA